MLKSAYYGPFTFETLISWYPFYLKERIILISFTFFKMRNQRHKDQSQAVLVSSPFETKS